MKTVYRFCFLYIFFLSSKAFSQQNLLYDQIQLAKTSGKAEFITVPQFFKETSVDRGAYGQFKNQDQVYFLDFDASLVVIWGSKLA